jgi:uncharacterized transporter YbjL
MSLYSEISSDLKKRLVYAHLAVLFMITVGTTVGFGYFDDLSFLDSLYLTTATVTTVGYGEMIFNPSAGTKIGENDLLIVIGKAESVKKLVAANN